MSDIMKNWLQFFADGASGGDGGEGAADTGVNAADAGRDHLEALGVPRNMAERHRQRMEKRSKGAGAAAITGRAEKAAESGTPGASAPAENTAAAPGEALPPGAGGPDGKGKATPQGAGEGGSGKTESGSTEWDAFFAKPENSARLQQMMADRGKSAQAEKQKAQELSRATRELLDELGRLKGAEAGKDGSYSAEQIAEFAKEIRKQRISDRALDLGLSEEVADKLDHAEALEERQRQADAAAQREAMLRENFNRVQQEARAVQEFVPGFELDKAMQEPEFVRRTAPGMKIPADQVYFGLHYREILKQQAETIAKLSRQAAAASVAAGETRPRENGSAAAAAVSAAPDLKAMSPEERRRYIKYKYPPERR